MVRRILSRTLKQLGTCFRELNWECLVVGIKGGEGSPEGEARRD